MSSLQYVVEKVEKPRLRNVTLAPLVASLRSTRYAHLRNLMICGVLVENDSAIDLVISVLIYCLVVSNHFKLLYKSLYFVHIIYINNCLN